MGTCRLGFNVLNWGVISTDRRNTSTEPLGGRFRKVYFLKVVMAKRSFSRNYESLQIGRMSQLGWHQEV